MVLSFSNMGQNASLPKGRRKSLRSFMGRSHHKGNLSHTFTVPDIDDKIELLNINIATEEELMTLPGVNRDIAKNIVDHRKAIGRFRKVEDLALVKGIGAVKLAQIRPEICVSVKWNQSCASSRAPSYDSLRSNDSKITNRSIRLVNVNRATVFELQGVPGISQEIAAGIVTLRNKKGEFKKLESLLKVKHINRTRFDYITRYLTLYEDENVTLEPAASRPSILSNGFALPQPKNGCINGINRTFIKSHLPNGLNSSSISDIFELLSMYSPRPVANDALRYTRNEEPVVRIGSWNLHEFTHEKASNLGVKEVVCRTILENSISLLAVQDIRDAVALKSICDELNKPTLRRIQEWKENSLNWNFCMLDDNDTKLGFIYDAAGYANIELISLMENDEDTKKHCEAVIANFLVGELNIQMVNMSIKKEADVSLLHDKISDLIGEAEMVMLCIDFSNCQQVDEKYLNLGRLKPVFPSTNVNIVPNLKTNRCSSHVSNVLTNYVLEKNLSQRKNVVSKGLTHLAIPNGWSWGGPASPFLPVWVEAFLTPKFDNTAL